MPHRCPHRLLVEQQQQQQKERDEEAAELAHEVEQRGGELERRGQELNRLHAVLAQKEAALQELAQREAELKQQVLEGAAAKGALQASKLSVEQEMERVRGLLERANQEKATVKRDRDEVRASAKADMARAADEMERMHKLLQVPPPCLPLSCYLFPRDALDSERVREWRELHEMQGVASR